MLCCGGDEKRTGLINCKGVWRDVEGQEKLNVVERCGKTRVNVEVV